MRVLVVAATRAEIEPLADQNFPNQTILITGVGMTATAASLARHLALHRYDLAVNLGIAGSFVHSIELGTLVEIREDTFSELGAEDGDTFLPASTLGLGENTLYPTARLRDFDLFLPEVRAITVNTVHGSEPSIATATTRWKPDIESMEGAAFFLACREAAVPCLQVRAISNYVERRARERWEIGTAIARLNEFAISMLSRFHKA